MSTTSRWENYTCDQNFNHENLQKNIDTVGDVIRDRLCLAFSPHDSVKDIIHAMHGHHSGAVGVQDASGRLIGLITEREILRRLFWMKPDTTEQKVFAAEDKAREDLLARDVMIVDPACLTEDTPVEQALDEIMSLGYRYMPVVSSDRRGALQGIAGQRELLYYAQAKARRELEAKDSLLSCFMHHEPYGKGVVI